MHVRIRERESSRHRMKAASARHHPPWKSFIDIDHQGMNIAHEPFLVAQRGHPGAAALRRTGEIVAEENAAMASRAVAHLPRSHVLMPDRHVVATLEGQAEEAARSVERGFDDSIELEIWLDCWLSSMSQRALRSFSA